MDLRSHLKIAPIQFKWEDGPKGPKVSVNEFWAEITRYGDGTAHFNVSNKFGMAGAPCPSVDAAKAEAEALIRTLVEQQIAAAIKTLEAYCLPAREPATCS